MIIMNTISITIMVTIIPIVNTIITMITIITRVLQANMHTSDQVRALQKPSRSRGMCKDALRVSRLASSQVSVSTSKSDEAMLSTSPSTV